MQNGAIRFSSTSWIVHHNQRDHAHDHHQSWRQTCIILQTPTNLIIANCLSTASPWHRFWVDLRLFWCKRKCSTYRFQIVQKLSFKTIMRDDFGVDACQKKIICGDCTSTLSILWAMCAAAHKIETQAAPRSLWFWLLFDESKAPKTQTLIASQWTSFSNSRVISM